MPSGERSSAFYGYYRSVGVVPADEWAAFVDATRRPLPTAFRININCAYPAKLRRQLREEFGPEHFGDGYERIAPYPLPWYPAQGGWQLGYDKKTLRQIALRSSAEGSAEGADAVNKAALSAKISSL